MSSEICNLILKADSGIRFAGIVRKDSSILSAKYREDAIPLLDKEKLEISALQAIIRWSMRTNFVNELGKALYSITTYEKVKRATIPIYDKEGALLLVSFDTSARPGPIIRKKIIPLLEEKQAPLTSIWKI